MKNTEKSGKSKTHHFQAQNWKLYIFPIFSEKRIYVLNLVLVAQKVCKSIFFVFQLRKIVTKKYENLKIWKFTFFRKKENIQKRKISQIHKIVNFSNPNRWFFRCFGLFSVFTLFSVSSTSNASISELTRSWLDKQSLWHTNYNPYSTCSKFLALRKAWKHHF